MNAAKIRTDLTLALALLASPTFAQTTIDDFATGQTQLQAAASCSGTSCSFVAGGMLGAERDIRAHLFSGSGAATAEVTGGAFVFSGVGTAFAEARLVWDGADGDADATAFTGLGGTNLTTGADSIILDVNSSSAGTVVIVEVFTSATSSSLYTLWLPAVSTPASFALPFTAFTTHLGSGATFTNVGAVSLTVRGPGAALSLNALRAGTGAAPAIGASKTVAIENDLGRAGTAEPGDTIKYTIQIDNKSGKPSSSNTALVDNLDANLTLVPGSAEASPIGIEDHYFQGGTTISIAAPGVLGNDVDPDGDAKSVAVTGSITTSKGATATVNADGSFSVPISADGTLDTFTYEVTDGNGITSAAVVTVGFVNQPPVVTTTGGTTAFTEDAGSVVVDNGLTVTDDGTTLASATVTITNLLDGANEILSALPSGSILAGDISYAAGTLTITRAGGLVSEYQTVLRSVRYENTSNAPSTTTRSLAFAVNDGFAASNTGTKSVSVTAANDAPVLTAGATLAYTENDPASVIDGTITVNDADSATLTQATVTLTTFQAGQDVLSFTNDGSTMGNVAVGTNVGGVLTLNSAGGTATLAQWQSALRAVRYANSSENPTTTARTVTWRVNDGAGANNLSNQPTSTINITAVNDAPVVTAGGTLNYTENQAATAIDTTITVADPDSANLTGATVQITANYANGDDVLSYVNALGITGVFTPATGTLTLSGTTTVANYQTALRNVRYNNTSENPTTGARTISWQVNDGAGVNNLSSTVTSTVNVTAVNDAPVALAKASAVQANMRRNTIDVSLLSGVTDVDNGVNGCVSTSFSVANIGATVTNGTVFNVNLGAGTFDFEPAAGFTGTATVSYTVSDTGCPGPAATSAPATISITVSGPVIWFVDNGVVGPGDGRLSNPFKTLASADAVDAANHKIFLASGTYASGIALNSGEALIGQGAQGAFDTVFGVTPPAGTIARPGLNGTRPTIAVTSGTGVVLNSGNNVQGLNVTNSNGSGITGAGVGTLVLADFDVTVTNGSALSVTTSGTVTATGTDNDLNSTNGAALNINAVNIGVGGVTFKSINSGPGANVGISLVNTGAAGGLTVTGSGTPGSGGTIAGKTGANGSTTSGIGIYLSSTSNVSLSRMQLNDFENFGIRGFNVAGFTLSNSTVNTTSGFNGNDDASNEGSVAFGDQLTPSLSGLSGTVNITNSVIANGFENNFVVSNHAGTMTFNMSGSTVRDNRTVSPGNEGLAFYAESASNMNIDVQSSSFLRNRANGIHVINQSSGTVNFDLGAPGVGGSGGTFTDNTLGVNINGNAAGATNFNVLNANFTVPNFPTLYGAGGASSQININLGGAAVVAERGAMTGNIVGNSIDMNFSPTGPAVRIIANGTDNTGGNEITFKFDGNTVTAGENFGVEVRTRDGNAGINATITNNVVTTNDGPLIPGNGAAESIRIDAGATSTAAGTGLPDSGFINLDLSGNNAETPDATGLFDVRIRQRFSTTYRLEDIGGGVNSSATAIAYLAGRNPATTGSNTFTADNTAAGSAGFLNIADVTEPPPPLLLSRGTHSAAQSAVSPLTPADLETTVAAALSRWVETGLTEAQVTLLRQLRFEVATLRMGYLAESDGTTIRVNSLAGGLGWVVAGGNRYETDRRGSSGMVDLLTTIIHEMGHALGFEDKYSEADRDDVMYGYLSPGVRRLPARQGEAEKTPLRP